MPFARYNRGRESSQIGDNCCAASAKIRTRWRAESGFPDYRLSLYRTPTSDGVGAICLEELRLSAFERPLNTRIELNPGRSLIRRLTPRSMPTAQALSATIEPAIVSESGPEPLSGDDLPQVLQQNGLTGRAPRHLFSFRPALDAPRGTCGFCQSIALQFSASSKNELKGSSGLGALISAWPRIPAGLTRLRHRRIQYHSNHKTRSIGCWRPRLAQPDSQTRDIPASQHSASGTGASRHAIGAYAASETRLPGQARGLNFRISRMH